MREANLTQFVLLPELKVIRHRLSEKTNVFVVEKQKAQHEVCYRCATPSSSTYDRRWVVVKDEPLRRARLILKILKRRYWCKPCRKPFTEPIAGIMPRKRTTQRFKRAVAKACDEYADLTKVRNHFQVSNNFIYRTYYEQLELKLREYQYPWPTKIGIDEHFFSRRGGFREFATVFTDMTNRRLKAVVLGKDRRRIEEQIAHIEGRENVRWVTIDLADSYKSFVFNHFPNAEIVADKFHVLRLLSPHLLRHRKAIAPDRMTWKAKRLLTMSSKKLDYFDRRAIWQFLEKHPELKELYFWKERLFGLYRIKGFSRAQKAMEYMLDEMKNSQMPEIKTLHRTLTRWKKEVLNYFKTRLTNARTEGFNNVAKLVQKRGYGYTNFENYRRRLLSACA